MQDKNMAARETDDARQEVGELADNTPWGIPNCLCDDCVEKWANRQTKLEEALKVCPNCNREDCFYDCDQSQGNHSLETDEQVAERMAAFEKG